MQLLDSAHGGARRAVLGPFPPKLPKALSYNTKTAGQSHGRPRLAGHAHTTPTSPGRLISSPSIRRLRGRDRAHCPSRPPPAAAVLPPLEGMRPTGSPGSVAVRPLQLLHPPPYHAAPCPPPPPACTARAAGGQPLSASPSNTPS